MDKRELRNLVRAKRQALSDIAQHQASHLLFKRLQKLPLFTQAKQIAFYLANDGEISPAQALKGALKNRQSVLLPCLTSGKSLEFRQYEGRGRLTKNRFGIPEPRVKCPITPLDAIDVILMPLVAFDRSGNRLGMGGGFYDRTLSARPRYVNTRPLLIGLAHHCQEVPALTTETWDIPLNYIVTDKQTIKVPHPNRS